MPDLSALDLNIKTIALTEAEQLIADGARAVVLTGSHVAGRANAASDIDLYAVGDGPEYSLHISSDHLVSISWRSPEAVRDSFNDPGQVGQMIPGWRSAWIVADASGDAATLQQAALEWQWDVLGGTRLDAWVAEEISGFAEEVHKLVAARRKSDQISAAIQRSVLALRLAPKLSVHYRWLYESENVLWAGMNERLGAAWATAQTVALGIPACSFEDTLDAALDLFALAATATWRTMNERQREVCREAVHMSGRSLRETP